MAVVSCGMGWDDLRDCGVCMFRGDEGRLGICERGWMGLSTFFSFGRESLGCSPLGLDGVSER